MKKHAVFLDRDGTIITERHYLHDPRKVALIRGAAEAIRRLSREGYLIVMVTNQSGVARGLFQEDAVEKVNCQIQRLLRLEGAEIDAAYYCPHHPKGRVVRYACRCDCRKPRPGMGYRAAKELDIDLSGSYMIGDKREDILFGQNCGMKNSFLVSTGYGNDAQLPEGYGVRVENILAAAEYILFGKGEKERMTCQLS